MHRDQRRKNCRSFNEYWISSGINITCLSFRKWYVLKSRWVPRSDALALKRELDRASQQFGDWLVSRHASRQHQKYRVSVPQSETAMESRYMELATTTGGESSTIYTWTVTTRGAAVELNHRLDQRCRYVAEGVGCIMESFSTARKEKPKPGGEIHLLGLQCSLQASAIRTRVGQSS